MSWPNIFLLMVMIIMRQEKMSLVNRGSRLLPSPCRVFALHGVQASSEAKNNQQMDQDRNHGRRLILLLLLLRDRVRAREDDAGSLLDLGAL